MRQWPQTLKLYLTGFTLSLALTILSFALATIHVFSGVLLLLAVMQAAVQLVFFMHFGQEHKPRWMMLLFYFMVLVVLIVVLGSLWIIFDLDKRVMMDGM